MPSAAVGLPPCGAGCSAYDGEDRVRRWLAAPSLPNRRALRTMPCDAQRLLGLRFRSYGPDVARDALVASLDPAWDPDDISLSYGRAPRALAAHDARSARCTAWIRRGVRRSSTSCTIASTPKRGRASSAGPQLRVLIGGVRHELTKDRFVVGRGGLSSDRAIDDPGVSRQHALVEHAGDADWLVDMGSTNGIEYQGQRIAHGQSAHGDRLRICDHALELLLHGRPRPPAVEWSPRPRGDKLRAWQARRARATPTTISVTR